MNHQYPIYTVETECQDCYKCVRECPVKAIRVEDGRAMVVPDLCVACGTCVAVCPVHAKKIRNDWGRARNLLQTGRKVYVSLAPSWVSEFPGVSQAQMATVMKRLGFAGVGETALGAQEVSAVVAEQLRTASAGVYLSSACPSAVEYIEKYLPDHASSITPVLSPLLSHCKLLRSHFGDDIAVVFFGPCISKKNEADREKALLNLALTFRDLHEWLEKEQVEPKAVEAEAELGFVPVLAEEGALYPMEGGMLETVKAYAGMTHVRYVTISGLDNLAQALDGLRAEEVTCPVFVEALSCVGGCINGPCMTKTDSTLSRRLRVENAARVPEVPLMRAATTDIQEQFAPMPIEVQADAEKALTEALKQVGKYSSADELNCGGCGYNTCRAFAQALLSGNAEPTMCVSFMRNQAQKKANALLRTMPSGVVIVDQDLHIIECNKRFAQLFGEENIEVFEACPGLRGCRLEKIIPFSELFETVLETGQEQHYAHYRHEESLFDITIFSIEEHQVVGGLLVDVTRQELRRDQIAQRANEVIQRNLSTVQEVACRLGEHMAETEILLRSIAEGYAVEDAGQRQGEGRE